MTILLLPWESHTWKDCLYIDLGPMLQSSHGAVGYLKPQLNGIATHSDVIMGTTASQFTSLTIVYSAVYSGTVQSKHQSSASLAFVWGIHRWLVNSPHKWPVTLKMFSFDDLIMHWGANILLPGFAINLWQNWLKRQPYLYDPTQYLYMIIIPTVNEVEGCILVSLCPSINPLVPPSVRLSVDQIVCSVSSTILAGSISYLHILSLNFRRCIVCLFFYSKLEFLLNIFNSCLSTSCSDLLCMWDIWGFLLVLFHIWYGNSLCGEDVSLITLVTVPH